MPGTNFNRLLLYFKNKKALSNDIIDHVVIRNDLSHDSKIDTHYTTNFRIQREKRVCKLLYTVSAHIQKISFQDSLYYAMGEHLRLIILMLFHTI